MLLESLHAVPHHPTFTDLVRSCLSAPLGNLSHLLQLWLPSNVPLPHQTVSNSFLLIPHMACHYRQFLHSATWPRRKSLQGQRRLYLGEWPAQLKSRGSRWRPHSCRTTENAGRMWLISESTTSHCTSNLKVTGRSTSLNTCAHIHTHTHTEQLTGFSHRENVFLLFKAQHRNTTQGIKVIFILRQVTGK